MQTLQAAMHELHLHDGFSAEDLKKQFRRLSVLCHPDKPGGSNRRMQRILAAREVCIEFLARPTHPEQFAQNLRKRADPPETNPGNGMPTPPASACPSADDLDAWTSHAVEFLAKLKEKMDQDIAKDNVCEPRSSRWPFIAVGICCWNLRLIASSSWRGVPSSSALQV